MKGRSKGVPVGMIVDDVLPPLSQDHTTPSRRPPAEASSRFHSCPLTPRDRSESGRPDSKESGGMDDQEE